MNHPPSKVCIHALNFYHKYSFNRSVTADNGILWSRGSFLGLWSQELLRWCFLHAWPPSRTLLENHVEVHQPNLLVLHHPPTDDGRVGFRHGEVRWESLHLSPRSTLGRKDSCSFNHHVHTNRGYCCNLQS